MATNRNLETAQRIFTTITKGGLTDLETDGNISRMREQFKLAREKSDLSSLDSSVLDASGKKTSDEVEAVIRQAQKDAEFRRGLRHARLLYDNALVAPAGTPHTADNIAAVHDTLNGIGIETDKTPKPHASMMQAIDAVLAKHENELAAQKTAQTKTARTR